MYGCVYDPLSRDEDLTAIFELAVPKQHTVFMNVFCVKKYTQTLFLARSLKLPCRHRNRHPHARTHRYTHTSTTKVLSLKWTSIRGRERSCHWGQKIAGGVADILTIFSEGITVKIWVWTCYSAVHGLLFTDQGGPWMNTREHK